MTPEEFVARWQNTTLNERQSYQTHFNDLCRMLNVPHPSGSGTDWRGNVYKFEAGGEAGFADVYLEGHFAIEYKAPHKYKDLNAAYDQLLRYREQLKNPPLLIVTDIEKWQIHTNFEGTEKRVYEFKHQDIASLQNVRDHLEAMFAEPKRLHPHRNTADVTKDAARGFQLIADNMRAWDADPARIARFLTKLVFCLFAEDIHLLPTATNSERGIFSELVHQFRSEPPRFRRYAEELFKAMASGGDVLMAQIPYFNGSLFDNVDVETLELEALTELSKVSQLNWASIEPAIFGTLFERALDKKKRAQLGAHYTSRDDILLIIEPVLMAPLRRQWAEVKTQAAQLQADYAQAATPKDKINLNKKREALRDGLLERVRTITVLDPACGSGNFLYVALQSLMTLEKEIIMDAVWTDLTRPIPDVHPRQMYGLEKDPIAHALASIVVWIGYIQWRRNNGYSGFKQPILEDLHKNIRNMDAILSFPATNVGATDRSPSGNGVEPDWPTVDVIVGNPPFLGGSKLRGELGDTYYETLKKVYQGRVAGGADLVTYWFEKARAHIEAGKAKRAGLIATKSIRQGANQKVLQRIKETGDIFLAHTNRAWKLEGAAVRVSMIGFDNGLETERQFYRDDAQTPLVVTNITPDLTITMDLTRTNTLAENLGIQFEGTKKGASFEVPTLIAKEMLTATNSSGYLNSAVVKPWMNGRDIVREPSNSWIIDFGVSMSLVEAQKYEKPFQYIERHVKPKYEHSRRNWWIHERSRPEMRTVLAKLSRYIATPRVAKHRIFVWLDKDVLPDSRLIVMARADDYFFGILHSRIHELWALRKASSHGVGNDPTYNAESCFETFPFPYVPGKEPLNDPCYQAIAKAARDLHQQREAWLKNGIGKAKDRTLTNLYNALNVFRGKETMKTVAAAGDFAPRLDQLHQTLDQAVCAAYGWDVSVLDDEEAILSNLLALNLARASS